MKIKQMGNNLLVINGDKKETIVFPVGHNFDKIFSLAYKSLDGSKTAEILLLKELEKYRKPVVKNKEIVEARIEKKKIDKSIREVKNIDITKLPITLTEDWMKILDETENKEGLQNFLLWLALNDNENTRKNFLSHFNANYPYITKNGFIVSVRRVWKEKAGDTLGDFIKSSYVKVKGWKKGTKNFSIVTLPDGNHELRKVGTETDEDLVIGNLDDLNTNYKGKEGTTYNSDYSKKYLKRSDGWKLGTVAEIHDKATHTEICGINQLHIRTNPMEASTDSSYGDTLIIVLVNPKDVINIVEKWKYTTSRFYIAAEISKSEIKEYFTKHWGDFDYDYLKIDMTEAGVTKAVQAENAVVKKGKIKELEEKKKSLYLNNKADHLDPEVYQKILANRFSLIKE